jgi:hypothetical protein
MSIADAAAAILFSNLGKRIRVSALIKAGDDAPDPDPETIEKGDAFSLGSTGYIVEECKVSRSRKIAKLDLTLHMPDSLSA